MRHAVLNCFSQSSAGVATLLGSFSEKEWQADLQWLDISGLALYLFHHLVELGQQELLPVAIGRRLQQNLADNTARNAGLLTEAIEISRLFTAEGLLFAHVKGMTLSPDSVPDPALRCQLDLDFLIDEEHAPQAQHVLEGLSYKLDVKAGTTWEFRAGVSEVARLQDLYRAKPQRSTDLHLVPRGFLRARVQQRYFSEILIPTLSPADQYVSQARHLLKHLCCAFTRAAWLLEFDRHTKARREDAIFWNQVVLQVADAPQAALALAVCSLLVNEIFGGPVPTALSGLVTASVTPPVLLWIKLYGRRALTADFPGTKVYLFLKTEVQPKKLDVSVSRRKELMPLRLPQMIAHGYTGESMTFRLSRYQMQIRYVLSRLRFHSVEGTRYAIESLRFQRRLRGLVR